jgi:D-alanyl-D-alanine carboxypeptidase (penicillin-binding protein 5/6)
LPSSGLEKLSSVSCKVILPDSLRAPVKEGDRVGKVEYYLDGECLGEAGIFVEKTVEAVTFSEIFLLLLRAFTLG